MKKLVSIILLSCMTLALSVAIPKTSSAQVTTPRYDATSGNTGLIIDYGYKAYTDAQGADSVILVPTYANNLIKITMTDSFYLKSPVVKYSYLGDRLVIIAKGSSGNKLKFAGTNFVTTGTATLSSAGEAILELIFDGAKYVEKSRTVQ